MSLRPSLAPLVVFLTAASLSLAACGGSGSPSGSTSTQSAEARAVNFARCMREHGVNVSAPTGGAGLFRITGSRLNPHTMEAAQKACQRYRPGASTQSLTPQERVARQEAVLKFARCMREHGISVHASTTGGGAGISIMSRRGEGGPNPESPAFQAAQKACQGLLPLPKGAKAAGPATSSSGPGGGGATGGFQVGG